MAMITPHMWATRVKQLFVSHAQKWLFITDEEGHHMDYTNAKSTNSNHFIEQKWGQMDN